MAKSRNFCLLYQDLSADRTFAAFRQSCLRTGQCHGFENFWCMAEGFDRSGLNMTFIIRTNPLFFACFCTGGCGCNCPFTPVMSKSRNDCLFYKDLSADRTFTSFCQSCLRTGGRYCRNRLFCMRYLIQHDGLHHHPLDLIRCCILRYLSRIDDDSCLLTCRCCLFTCHCRFDRQFFITLMTCISYESSVSVFRFFPCPFRFPAVRQFLYCDCFRSFMFFAVCTGFCFDDCRVDFRSFCTAARWRFCHCHCRCRFFCLFTAITVIRRFCCPSVFRFCPHEFLECPCMTKGRNHFLCCQGLSADRTLAAFGQSCRRTGRRYAFQNFRCMAKSRNDCLLYKDLSTDRALAAFRQSCLRTGRCHGCQNFRCMAEGFDRSGLNMTFIIRTDPLFFACFCTGGCGDNCPFTPVMSEGRNNSLGYKNLSTDRTLTSFRQSCLRTGRCHGFQNFRCMAKSRNHFLCCHDLSTDRTLTSIC